MNERERSEHSILRLRGPGSSGGLALALVLLVALAPAATAFEDSGFGDFGEDAGGDYGGDYGGDFSDDLGDDLGGWDDGWSVDGWSDDVLADSPWGEGDWSPGSWADDHGYPDLDQEDLYSSWSPPTDSSGSGLWSYDPHDLAPLFDDQAGLRPGDLFGLNLDLDPLAEKAIKEGFMAGIKAQLADLGMKGTLRNLGRAVNLGKLAQLDAFHFGGMFAGRIPGAVGVLGGRAFGLLGDLVVAREAGRDSDKVPEGPIEGWYQANADTDLGQLFRTGGGF